MKNPPVVLTIGGSDSSGCHGVQADLRALTAEGVHTACAVTVVTAQSTASFLDALAVPVGIVAAQIEAVLGDLPVAAVKTGMLGRVEIIELVARLAADGRLPHLVVDPVLVNRHNAALFGAEVVEAYRELLVPRAALLCPNRDEAALLAGPAVTTPIDPATVVSQLGAPTVLTAGRSEGPDATDLLWDGSTVVELPAARIATVNNAGSGDAFSAIVAAGLAQGMALHDAVRRAKHRVHAALAAAAEWQLGAGPGPLDHLGHPGRTG